MSTVKELKLTPAASIFTPTKADALKNVYAIKSTATDAISRGDEIGIKLSNLFENDDQFQDALNYTGYTTELIQDEIAELAQTDYNGKYIPARNGVKSMIRGEVLRVWAFLFKLYRTIGLPEEEARRKATAAVVPYKEAQREIFLTMFPMTGEKVKQQY